MQIRIHWEQQQQQIYIDTDTVARSEPNSEQANRTKIKSKLQRLENKLRKGVLANGN